jgi:superfamily II DNA or RNA helicase
MSRREELIRKGLNKWAKSLFKGILNYATGVGKSYAAILAIKYVVKKNSKAKVLIVCPTVAVIDNFMAEFTKFKEKSLLNNCEFICYASIAKQKGEYDLVILDEIHHVVTDRRMIFFKRTRYRALLGLSASLTPLQKIKLAPYCRVVDKLDLEDVASEGFISNYTIINYPIELTKKEREDYDRYTNTINWTYSNFSKQAWRAITARASLVYTANNKIKTIDKIVDLFPDKYGIIFSLKKQYAEEIADKLGTICIAIHSGHTKKQRKAKLKAFKDGRTRVRLISAPKILDEGVTLPRLSYGILVARYSKERQHIQSIGRLLRNDIENKHSIAIRLYAKDTVEEKWVEQSQKESNVIKVENYGELKKVIREIQSLGT